MHAAFPITVASVATVAYAVFAVWTELSRKRAATRLSVASATSPSGGGSAIGPLVIIIGLGGVGSHTANLLLRGGVRRLRLIDFDQVTLSSLNRNATAVRADVGTPKVVALREQMLRVAPSAQIEAIVALFDAAAAPRLLAGEPALVVDCIDDLATKAALLGYCVREGLPVLCALGAGGKGDCCAFHVGRLSEVFNDPIAASLLKRLKKQRVEGTDDEAPTTPPPPPPCPEGFTLAETTAAEKAIADLFRQQRCEDLPLDEVRAATGLPSSKLETLLAFMDNENKLMCRKGQVYLI
jgi:molybdopterin/thiamine biosynthesis adenylyltransferase